MISDRLPTLGASPVERPRGRRLLGPGAGPAEPAAPCWAWSSCVVFFGIQAPGLLTSGGAGQRARHRRPAGHRRGRGRAAADRRPVRPVDRGRWRSPARLVTALLIDQAGLGHLAGAAGSLAAALLVGLVNGLPGGQHRAAQLPGHAGDLPGAAGQRRRPASERARRVGPGDRPGRRARLGRRRETVFGVDAAAGRRPVPRLAAVVAGADRAGHLGAVADPLRQRRVRQRRRPPGGPPAGRPGAPDDARPVLPDRRGRAG